MEVASASGEPKQRGWGKIRPKYQVTPPPEQEQKTSEQETPQQKMTEDLFVWKRYFIHQ